MHHGLLADRLEDGQGLDDGGRADLALELTRRAAMTAGVSSRSW
jgi:hypothetical protein